jgi:hypothetical protein
MTLRVFPNRRNTTLGRVHNPWSGPRWETRLRIAFLESRIGRVGIPIGNRVPRNRFLETGFPKWDFPSGKRGLEIPDSRNRIPQPVCISPGQRPVIGAYFRRIAEWWWDGTNPIVLRPLEYQLGFPGSLFPDRAVGP